MKNRFAKNNIRDIEYFTTFWQYWSYEFMSQYLNIESSPCIFSSKYNWNASENINKSIYQSHEEEWLFSRPVRPPLRLLLGLNSGTHFLENPWNIWKLTLLLCYLISTMSYTCMKCHSGEKILLFFAFHKHSYSYNTEYPNCCNFFWIFLCFVSISM